MELEGEYHIPPNCNSSLTPLFQRNFLMQVRHTAVRVFPVGVWFKPLGTREPLASGHGLLQRLPLHWERVHEAVPGESASRDGEKGSEGAESV